MIRTKPFTQHISAAAITLLMALMLTMLIGCAGKKRSLHCEYISTNTQIRVTAVIGDTATVVKTTGGESSHVPVAEFPETGVRTGQVYDATDKRIKSGACLAHYYYIKRLAR